MKREDIRETLLPSLTAQLDGLAGVNHCGAGFIAEVVERSKVRARITGVDRLACEVELISATDPGLNMLSGDQLRCLADRLSEQLYYLEERLVVLEIDDVLPLVQMRSESPRVDDDARSYFEVQIGKSGVTLQRYSKQLGTRRGLIPTALTRDVFSRVCIDLVSAVQRNDAGE